MNYRLLADLTLLIHLLFIIFVLLGGLLCLHRKQWAFLHIPSALWAVWVEWSGRICPLTPLENRFREMASGQGYPGGFVEHYLIPLIYPGNLNDTIQLILGGVVIGTNILIYLYVLQRRTKLRLKVDE